MPNSYADQLLKIDPFVPPAAGTSMTKSVLTLTDQNDDSDCDRFDNDSVNGIDITASYPGASVILNLEGVGNATYTGVTFYLADGSPPVRSPITISCSPGTKPFLPTVRPQAEVLCTQRVPECRAVA